MPSQTFSFQHSTDLIHLPRGIYSHPVLPRLNTASWSPRPATSSVSHSRQHNTGVAAAAVAAAAASITQHERQTQSCMHPQPSSSPHCHHCTAVTPSCHRCALRRHADVGVRAGSLCLRFGRMATSIREGGSVRPPRVDGRACRGWWWPRWWP